MSSDAIIDTPAFDQGVVPNVDTNMFRVELAQEMTRFSLRMREENIDAFAAASGLALPTQIRGVHDKGAEKILCLGPNEWLVIALSEQSAAIKEKCAQYAASPFSLVDISHRNVGLRLTGEKAASMINMGCPLDLSLDAFPVGKCTRTVFERAEIILMRKSETDFIVELWRSFAPYFLSIIEKGSNAL